MNLELSKLPLDFYTDPVWREQDYDKEQQSTRNEGINVYSFFFFFPLWNANLGIFLICSYTADRSSLWKTLEKSCLFCQDADSRA